VQGFYFSEPVVSSEFPALFEKFGAVELPPRRL
jgi:hypothetical protein